MCNRVRQIAVMVATILMLSACALPHYVHSDYAQYLANNRGQIAFPRISVKAYYYLDEKTQNHQKEIRSIMTGYANQWIVEFGPILDSTMQFGDIHQAFISLEKSDAPSQPNDLLLLLKLVDYRFEGFEATVNLKITATYKGTILFEKPYEATGRSQGGKMFWGGEDFRFSQRVIEAGFPLFVDTRPRLIHRGMHNFGLEDGEVLLPGKTLKVQIQVQNQKI